MSESDRICLLCTCAWGNELFPESSDWDTSRTISLSFGPLFILLQPELHHPFCVWRLIQYCPQAHWFDWHMWISFSHFTAGKREAWRDEMAFPSPASWGSGEAKLEAWPPGLTFLLCAFVSPTSSSVIRVSDGDKMFLVMNMASGLLARAPSQGIAFQHRQKAPKPRE